MIRLRGLCDDHTAGRSQLTRQYLQTGIGHQAVYPPRLWEAPEAEPWCCTVWYEQDLFTHPCLNPLRLAPAHIGPRLLPLSHILTSSCNPPLFSRVKFSSEARLRLDSFGNVCPSQHHGIIPQRSVQCVLLCHVPLATQHMRWL